MNDLDSKLAGILNKRFIEIFQIGLKKPLHAAHCGPSEVPFIGSLFHAAIALTGQNIQAELVIQADKKFLHETHPERRYGGLLENSDYLDWISEISNRTLAGSKPSIAELGYILRLEQPRAKHGQVSPVDNGVRELTQVLESEGFYCIVSLRIKQLEALPQKAS